MDTVRTAPNTRFDRNYSVYIGASLEQGGDTFSQNEIDNRFRKHLSGLPNERNGHYRVANMVGPDNDNIVHILLPSPGYRFLHEVTTL